MWFIRVNCCLGAAVPGLSKTALPHRWISIVNTKTNPATANSCYLRTGFSPLSHISILQWYLGIVKRLWLKYQRQNCKWPILSWILPLHIPAQFSLFTLPALQNCGVCTEYQISRQLILSIDSLNILQSNKGIKDTVWAHCQEQTLAWTHTLHFESYKVDEAHAHNRHTAGRPAEFNQCSHPVDQCKQRLTETGWSM